MSPWIDVAGWTLVHFVWQGAVLAGITVVSLSLLRDRTPQTRYLVACAALVAMLAAPLVTSGVLSRSARVTTVAVRSVIPNRSQADADTVPDGAATRRNLALARGLSNAEIAPPGPRAWLPLIVLLWMAGVGVLLVRLAGGWWRISRLYRSSKQASPSSWIGATSRIATTIGLSRVVRVVDSTLVDTPTVIGVFRPVVLLPIAALAGLSPSQVEAILAHELAHIRRHDFLVNVLQTVAETVLFYHPAVWWMSARIRVEREHCCDAVALSVYGDAVSYAEALVELETWRTVHSPLAVAATGGPLLTRVRRLLGKPADQAPRPLGATIVAGAAALTICVTGASHYVLAAQPNVTVSRRAVDVNDPAAWSMIFTQADSTMRFVGFRGRDLIRFAYQVPADRVVGGPRWIDEQILQIVSTLDHAPRADEMPGIVRMVLEDKLHLKTHTETRNFPVLALVLARGDRVLGRGLRTASQPCFDVQQWIAAGQPRDQVPSQSNRIPACGGEIDSPWGWTKYASVTMPQLAEELRDYVRGWRFAPREPPPPQLGPQLVAVKQAPEIVDRTALPGRYDVEFTAFYPTTALMSRFPVLTSVFEPMGFTSIHRTLADQLGLALVETEAPHEVIVIDSAERP